MDRIFPVGRLLLEHKHSLLMPLDNRMFFPPLSKSYVLFPLKSVGY